MRTDRTVTVAGVDVLRADFDAHNIGGRLEAGYRVLTPLVGITPYIAGAGAELPHAGLHRGRACRQQHLRAQLQLAHQ